MENKEIRILQAPASGNIVPLQSLCCGENPDMFRGEGFAVTVPDGLLRFLTGFSAEIKLRSPADGAVTAVGRDFFRIRTGDGLELETVLCSDAEFFVRSGEVIMAGECFGKISTQDFFGSAAGIIVRFCESNAVSELHIYSGQKIIREPAAEYKITSGGQRIS